LLSLNASLAALSAAVAAAAAPVAAGEKTVASYCSPSGDICYGVFNRAGKVHLRITTAAHYFGRYGLCVVLLRRGPDPQHALRCGSFPLFHQGGGIWASTVRYARQYPVTLPGRYRVTWRSASGPLGPPLFFRLPLRG
jgi:hypothetical protein